MKIDILLYNPQSSPIQGTKIGSLVHGKSRHSLLAAKRLNTVLTINLDKVFDYVSRECSCYR